MFDRSAILRAAHAETRRQMQPTREFSYALKWCPERRLYVQPQTYAYVFAYELKKAWRLARQALPVVDRILTPAEAAEVSSLRYLASIEPLNGAGAAAFRAAHARADAIVIATQRRAA